jgi:hypothetical protein
VDDVVKNVSLKKLIKAVLSSLLKGQKTKDLEKQK